jgi:AAA+ superfamily predicted ATPase
MNGTLRSAEPVFVSRVRLRAQRRVLWLRRLWAEAAPGQGLSIPHEEVDRVLADQEARAEAERTFYEADAEARALTEQLPALDAWAADAPSWRRLRQVFALSGPELDLLMLAAAAEIEPALRRVYGYLHDDAGACQVTPWLAAQLFEWPAGLAIGPESALVRWGLARPVEGTSASWSALTPWTVDPHILSCLIRGQGWDPALGGSAHLVPADRAARLCLYPALLAEMVSFVKALLDGQRPVAIEIELIGPEGTGKRSLAAQLCAQLGTGLLVADAGALLGPDVSPAQAGERVLHAVRAARLGGTPLYWHDAGAAQPRLWSSPAVRAELTLLGVPVPLAPATQAGVVRRSFRVPGLTQAQRLALWRHLSDRPAPSAVADWRLTPAEIGTVALSAPAGEPTTLSTGSPPVELLLPVPCPFTWDDFVVAPQVRRHLGELESQTRLRWQVYEDWGFARLCPLGRGITALFAGPSGTGKTMAAQVLARALGVALYRVDLASVVSKYVGETEKQLKRVFDWCERAHVLILFDEADAFFGQRTQVKDAHDRYANIEIDYLLQRMEQFDGLAVLATNRKGDLDQAFLRRLRFIVDFLPPGPAERLELWRRALLPRSPSGAELLDGIEYETLAQKLTLTGAGIKAAALAAAFLARAENTRIAMRHVLHAARRELVKQGLAPRPGELESILETKTP